jgi:RNA exonuclease 1
MRMHSVLSTFFQAPVTNEEKRRRLVQKLTCTFYWTDLIVCLPYECVVENNRDKDLAQYLLTREQMIENEYPIPSYVADIFEKPDGWVETPEPVEPSLLDLPGKQNDLPKQKVYAIDCEMV